MRERTFTFGSHGGLVGVVCEPDAAPRAGAPAVLLFNVGLNHRVGPGRLNVDLARRLAQSGYNSLRFDLSGLGDSEPRNDTRPDTERAVLDLQEAMNFLQKRYGTQHFLVIALCSGTDHAHAITLADPRISGAVFIDGYAYVTPGYHWHQFLMKAGWIFEPFRWRRWVSWKLKWLRGDLEGGDFETRVTEPIFDRTYPPQESFRADLKRMLERDVKLLYVYSSDAWFFNHRAQFARMAGWQELQAGVEVEHWRDVDHLFRTLASRRRLVDRLEVWVKNWFPGIADEPVRQKGVG